MAKTLFLDCDAVEKESNQSDDLVFIEHRVGMD